MPKLFDAAARAARDQRLLRLYLAGHSYRAMAGQPGVGLSLRGVVKAVRRQLAGMDAPLVADALVSAAFAEAYPAACAGDRMGVRALRRLGPLLEGCGSR